MAAVILIDAVNQQVRKIDLPDDPEDWLDELRTLLGGGWISCVMEWDFTCSPKWNSDSALYVAKDCMTKPQEYFFQLEPPPGTWRSELAAGYIYPGCGIITGEEHYDDEQRELSPDDVRLTVAEVQAMVRFLSRAEVDAWAAAHAAEPARVSWSFGPVSEIAGEEGLERVGELYASLPRRALGG